MKKKKSGNLKAIKLIMKAKAVLIITAILAAVFIFVFVVMLIGSLYTYLVSSEQASKNANLNSGDIAVAITVTGTYSGNQLILDFSGGISATGVVAKKSGSVYKGTQKNVAANMSLPSLSSGAQFNTGTWMPQFDQKLYSVSLDKNSKQYILNQSCINDSEGFRRKGQAYLVALGTYYGTIGTEFEMTFDKNGKRQTIKAVMGDAKSDTETDSTHQFHEKGDKSIVEFIMSDRSNKNGVTISNKFGKLISIKKNSGTINVTATVKGDTITLSGTCGGTPFSASGVIKDGQITASGFYGANVSGNGKLIWPLSQQGTITSPFGYRTAGSTNGVGTTNHAGIDVGVPNGTEVLAAASGTVTIAGCYGGYGYAVKIDHGNGLTTMYGHNSKVNVSVGDKVTMGQVIALAGSTGNSTGPHLHFEVRQNEIPKDPMIYFNQK